MKITARSHTPENVKCSTCGAILKKSQVSEHHHDHRYNTGHRR